MALSSENYKNSYTGDDLTVTAQYTFLIFDEDELEIIKKEVATEIETTLVLNTDYTVDAAGIGEPGGGDVDFTAALASGYTYTIRRKVPYLQEIDYVQNDNFDTTVLERQLDRTMMAVLQLKEIIDRAVVRAADKTTQVILPELVANGYLKCNAAGDGVIFSDEVVTTVGTYTGTISYGLYASRPASPGQGDIYYCTDTDQILACRVAGTWSDAAKFSRLVLTPVALTAGATVNTNAALGNYFTLTANQNFTLANPTNPTNRQKVIWEIKQDGTGGRVISYGTKFRAGVDGFPVLSTTAAKIDFIGAVYNSTDDKWDIIAFDEGHS